MTFHRFNPDFFSSGSYIKYDGDYITIEQNGDESDAMITRKREFEDKRYNTKLCFIPSERNLISAVKNLDRTYKASELDILLNYLLEWDEVKDFYGTKNPLRLSIAHNIQYLNDGGADFIYLSQNEKKLPVFYASSGVQSAMPIEVMVDRYSSFVGEKAGRSEGGIYHSARGMMPCLNKTSFVYRKLMSDPTEVSLIQRGFFGSTVVAPSV